MRSAVAKATAPPEPPSPMMTRDDRHADLPGTSRCARDRLGLAALLGALAGIGAGGVDQRDHRQAEAVGEVHQPDRLAVALGPRHAEVALDARAGVVALLVADHHHGAVVEAREAAHHRVVVGEVAVAGERGPFAEQAVDVVLAVRPVGVARDLRLPPGIEVAVEVVEQRRGLLVERRRPRPRRSSRRSCGRAPGAPRPCPRSRRGPFRSRDRSACGAPAAGGYIDRRSGNATGIRRAGRDCRRDLSTRDPSSDRLMNQYPG